MWAVGGLCVPGPYPASFSSKSKRSDHQGTEPNKSMSRPVDAQVVAWLFMASVPDFQTREVRCS